MAAESSRNSDLSPLWIFTMSFGFDTDAPQLQEWKGRIQVGMSNSLPTPIRGSVRDMAIVPTKAPAVSPPPPVRVRVKMNKNAPKLVPPPPVPVRVSMSKNAPKLVPTPPVPVQVSMSKNARKLVPPPPVPPLGSISARPRLIPGYGEDKQRETKLKTNIDLLTADRKPDMLSVSELEKRYLDVVIHGKDIKDEQCLDDDEKKKAAHRIAQAEVEKLDTQMKAAKVAVTIRTRASP
ncbi:hypothetical protein CQW23_35020 [Capsicum baccatum]|uniref:Uncharacterized protein n=1 Tax=Capsicum baccatum TaxID=33114 RepID=A0A2G2UXI8_CAPBA|nr:hypothetical protein CQW23_35020 [Capsicum baccatum]